MELIDMIRKADKSLKDTPSEGAGYDKDHYPYGLSLSFGGKDIDKIPSLKDYKVGDKVKIEAEAVVESISMSQHEGEDEDHRICIQIHKINCEPLVKKSLQDMSMSEYKKARMVK